MIRRIMVFKLKLIFDIMFFGLYNYYNVFGVVGNIFEVKLSGV